jgi:hypothetical protein
MLEGWSGYSQSVWEFVENTSPQTGIPLLDNEIEMILSPAHGDLNANNVFIWLTHPDQPFFIDFPTFQARGHALQDFARLEVEVKYTLMDRQEDSPAEQLPSFDLTPSQFVIWRQLEDYLLAEGWAEERTWDGNAVYTGNVGLSLALVQRIRRYACRVQSQKNPTVGFLEEYLPALLFHTLRAISYTSLSPLKRLLAVYSAARMLERLRQSSTPEG